ncbi:beta-lactamase family protein [Streptomyces sp. MUM 203J]|uniref:serine hydrolase domain-containing protein n=1 Tax=Streptomyces sp. MUM 203J TaxID=2791990 RepID=UPI001F04B857|nr:serine hydrolase domain-containing protein [Streptomyces sp. MUM 203J]MCH0541180.1 beta-lactamase family protein [Streptomyces sp. MUM 203J]
MSVRTTRTALVGVAVATALGATSLTSTAVAAPTAPTPHGHRATQAAIDDIVRNGAPGVVAEARDRYGVWKGDAGVADRDSGRKRRHNDRYRVASITKIFVSTVMLQLEAEGRLDLDDSVEKWLPGTVRGNGHDGRSITLRRLLNHTSGIYDYTSDPDFRATRNGPGFLEHRYDTWTPDQLVAVAMRHEPRFAPGTDWSYSNTNYVLAGLVIEKVTGRPYGSETERRIIRPLKLRATSVPGTDVRLPRPSGRAYSTLGADPADPATTIHDVTELNPSGAWAAGELISDNADLQRFLSALLTGRLLPERQLKEMTTAVPVDGSNADDGYGLGLRTLKLSCGTQVWGHTGGIRGSSSFVAADRSGTHTMAANANGDWTGGLGKVLEAEFCR